MTVPRNIPVVLTERTAPEPCRAEEEIIHLEVELTRLAAPNILTG